MDPDCRAGCNRDLQLEAALDLGLKKAEKICSRQQQGSKRIQAPFVATSKVVAI
jgi:hypothetical protein